MKFGWDDTICSFAVLTDDVLVVPDTKNDPRFACQPFALNEPDIRFYASALLITPDGFNIGNFCLVDSKPHQDLTPGIDHYPTKPGNLRQMPPDVVGEY